MNSSQELLERITRPSPRLIDDIAKISGDIIIVGAGGKVGPSLAVTARRACEAAGLTKRILAVSKLDDPAAAETMRHWGVQVVSRSAGFAAAGRPAGNGQHSLSGGTKIRDL